MKTWELIVDFFSFIGAVSGGVSFCLFGYLMWSRFLADPKAKQIMIKKVGSHRRVILCSMISLFVSIMSYSIVFWLLLTILPQG
jgi:hypothetical protein